MRAYPLIRRKWSNEHIMAMLFLVILLYLIPRWAKAPSEIPAFLAVLAVALIIDTIAGFIKYKRLVCSVSAAITAGVLQVITPNVPLWGRLIGVAAAIVLGKVLWDGTGKNTLNPALVGYLAIYFLFSGGYAPITPSALLIPALVLSLPFILFRPFASLGLMGGMGLAMVLSVPSVDWKILLVNCLFFGCIVITDPVTTTSMKLPGLVGCFAAGFIPLYTANPAVNFALSILIFNLLSYLLDDMRRKPVKRVFHSGIFIKDAVMETDYSSPAVDLTGQKAEQKEAGISEVCSRNESAATKEVGSVVSHHAIGLDSLTPEQIIMRIGENGVYGAGGAAFPTMEKIRTLLASGKEKKYLIINGVECDPGLIHDKWLLRNRSEDIGKGISAVSKCIGSIETILAVKDPAGLKFPGSIKVHQVKNYYPAGYEKLLVWSVLKRKLPDGAIPSKEGILVLNVQTLVMIAEAVFLNRPVSSKYITVSDMKSKKAVAVKVSHGDSILKVIDTVYPGKQPVFTGGGAMQAQMADEESLVTKESNFIAVSNMPRYKESPYCSSCGACETHCPQGLRVSRIAALADEGKLDEINRYHPEKCIKCGICSYVCPAGRNLSARVTEAKASGSKNSAAG